MKEEAILQTAYDRYKLVVDSDSSQAELALDDIKFELNEDDYQWPADIKQQRESDNPPRPCLSINKVSEKIDQVEGEFRQLKPSFKIRGVDSQADPKIANIISGIIRNIEYNSTARSAYNTSHTSVLRCGRGAWRIDIVDSEDDPFSRDIEINRIPNVLTVKCDPSAKKQDRSDAKWWFITEELTTEELDRQYPEAKQDDWIADDITKYWGSEKTRRIAEYWWKEDEDQEFHKILRDVNGQPEHMTVKADMIKENDQILKSKTVKIPAVKWCKMVYGKIVDGPHDWPSRYIPIIYEIGKETNVEGKQKTRGMIRNAKTPCQMYNFWSSSSTEQIALAPKAPYLVTPKMIAEFQPMWDQANIKNFMYLLFNPDPNAPGLGPKRETPPQLSPAIASELMRMDHDIMSAMGIYQAQLGDKGQEVSGRAILARQKQGSIGSYTYTDNFQIAYVYSLKIITDLIPYVYDTERIQRIRGEDGVEKTVPINARPNAPMMRDQEFSEDLLSRPKSGVTEYINDMTVGKYDVVASIGPAYDTQRAEASAVLMELIKNIPNLGAATVDLLVQMLDVPEVADELVKRAKKIVPVNIRGLEPGEQPPAPPGPTKEMIELQKLKLEGLKEMREAFEGKLDAVAKLITAEAKERGNQIAEVVAFVDQLKQREQMKNKQDNTQIGPGQGGAVQ